MHRVQVQDVSSAGRNNRLRRSFPRQVCGRYVALYELYPSLTAELQVIHVPNLLFLSDLFSITYLCDVSKAALEHTAHKVPGTNACKTTLDPGELCSSPDVDVVFVVNSDEYHVEHAVLALQHGKHVFVEKPMALTLRDADVLIAVEKKSKGSVMVGYQRRYAKAFVEAVEEIGGIGEILYARVRGVY